jgi:hypothetical protein
MLHASAILAYGFKGKGKQQLVDRDDIITIQIKIISSLLFYCSSTLLICCYTPHLLINEDSNIPKLSIIDYLPPQNSHVIQFSETELT